MDSPYLKSFLDPNGNASWQGQRNAGDFEFSKGWSPSSQQSYETSIDYSNRMNQYNWRKDQDGR